MHQLRHEPVSKKNFSCLEQVEITPEQSRLLGGGSVYKILASAYVRLHERNWDVRLVFHNDQVIGHYCLVYPDDRSLCSLSGLVVDARWQSQGFGRQILKDILENCRREFPGLNYLGLTVHPDNKPAIALYESSGFEMQENMFHNDRVMRYYF